MKEQNGKLLSTTFKLSGTDTRYSLTPHKNGHDATLETISNNSGSICVTVDFAKAKNLIQKTEKAQGDLSKLKVVSMR